MKRVRNILLIVFVCGIAALAAFFMFGTGTTAAGTTGTGFGNCMVQYQWTSRNEGPKRILNLVVCSEEPSEFGGRPGSSEIHARFANGSISTTKPDGASLVWLEPGKQPRRLDVEDLQLIVTQIEKSESASVGMKFTGPEDFLAGIRKLAEQAEAPNRR
jgi:hypothetical protein